MSYTTHFSLAYHIIYHTLSLAYYIIHHTLLINIPCHTPHTVINILCHTPHTIINILHHKLSLIPERKPRLASNFAFRATGKKGSQVAKVRHFMFSPGREVHLVVDLFKRDMNM